MTTKAYAIKGPDGEIIAVGLTHAQAWNASANRVSNVGVHDCVPVTIIEGEPKVVVRGSGDGYWVREEDYHHRPDKARFTEVFYTHPPGTPALLRDNMKILRWLDNAGGLGLDRHKVIREQIERIEVALREAE